MDYLHVQADTPWYNFYITRRYSQHSGWITCTLSCMLRAVFEPRHRAFFFCCCCCFFVFVFDFIYIFIYFFFLFIIYLFIHLFIYLFIYTILWILFLINSKSFRWLHIALMTRYNVRVYYVLVCLCYCVFFILVLNNCLWSVMTAHPDRTDVSKMKNNRTTLFFIETDK